MRRVISDARGPGARRGISAPRTDSPDGRTTAPPGARSLTRATGGGGVPQRSARPDDVCIRSASVYTTDDLAIAVLVLIVSLRGTNSVSPSGREGQRRSGHASTPWRPLRGVHSEWTGAGLAAADDRGSCCVGL